MIEILLWATMAFFGMMVLTPSAGTAVKQGPDRAAAQRGARDVSQALGWPELEPFLDAAAHRESRWHPSAGARRVGTNGAIGMWQVIPTTAFPTRGMRKEFTRAEAIALGGRLLDPQVNAAAIGDYLVSLRSWNPDATLGELRAAMFVPEFVRGRPTGLAPAGRLRDRFPTAEAWADRFDLSLSEFDKSIEVSGVDVDPSAPANFPSGRIPPVSELAAQIGARLT
ncbi:hypothetical protein LCGC14_2138680 [marine sediment metagenome]|uniref:Transglycosylase SLT domain-containing protein n=1 Tax=marine sediment metagenome TaxID=412755 RepID=A0A0F9GC12_9ZZZZ